MKTKLARISKRSLATVLAFLMIFSTLMVGSIATADAADTSRTFFIGILNNWDNQTNWSFNLYSSSSATTAVATVNGSAATLIDSNHEYWGETFNIYAVNVSNTTAGYCDIIRDGNKYCNGGSNRETIGSNNFIRFGWRWTAMYTYTLGDSISIGTNPSSGVYVNDQVTLTPTLTNATFNAADSTTYSVKWDNSSGSECVSGEDYTISSNKFTPLKQGTFYIAGSTSYHTKGFTSLTGTADGNTTISVTGYYVASGTSNNGGSAAFSSTAWGPSDSDALMTKTATNTYSITFSNVTAGTYYYKVTHGTWNTSYPANNKSITVPHTGDSVTITYNSSTHAVSDSITHNSYTVTLNENGGTINAGNVTSYTCGTGATLPTNVTKTNYTFGGWYANSSLTGDAVTSIGTTATGNKEYWAKWSGASYTVSYKDQGASNNVAFSGTINSGNVTSYTYGVGATLPTDVTKTGYTFDGWYTTYNGSTKATSISTTATGNKTYYAKWTAKSYDITYKDQGNAAFSGTHASDYPTSHTYGTATTLKSASKTGYSFGGWFTTSACTGSAVTSLDATAYTANITLYAKWTQNNYTISSDNASGTTSAMYSFEGTSTAHYGGSPTFTLSANSGYAIDSITVKDASNNDVAYTVSGTTYTITSMPASDVTVTVTARSDSSPAISVSYTGASGAAIATSGSVTTSTRHNVTVKFTNQATMSNGTAYSWAYTRDGVQQNSGSGTTSSSGGDITIKSAAALGAGTWVFTISANGKSASVTVVVNQSQTLTVNSATNTSSISGSYTNEFGNAGTISAAGTFYCNSGTSYSVTYTADSLYCFNDTNGTTTNTKSGTITATTSVSADTRTEKKYTLTITKKLGSADATNVTTQTVKTVTTSTVSVPSATGYTQTEWRVTSGNVYVNGTAKATNATISAGDIAKVTLRANATLQANFTENSYTLTINKKLGSASATSSGTQTVKYFTTSTVTAPTQSGYSISNWTVTSGTVYVNGTAYAATSNISTAGNLSNVTLHGAATIQANLTETKYAVTTAAEKLNNVALGTTSGGGQAGIDTAVSINASAKPGYEFVNWTGSNLTFTSSTTASTTVKATAAATATANFRQTRLYLDISANSTWKGANYYKAYFFNNSNPYTTGTNSGFVNMTAVPGQNDLYYVDIPSGFYNAQTASHGFLFLCKTDNNNDWSNKTAQTADLDFDGKKNKYVIGASNDSWADSPYFPPATYTVGLSSGTGGSVSFNSGATTVNAGGSADVTVGSTSMPVVATPATGYTFNTWTASSGVSLGSSASTASNTVTASANGTLAASFTPVSHTIQKTTSNTSITITGPTSGATSASTGQTVTFTASANTDYTLGTVKYRMGSGSWSSALTPTNGVYSFVVPGDDNASNKIEISAEAAETKYTVTVNNDGHGTVNASSKQIGYITAVALPTPTASSGYQFAGWKVTNGTVYYNSTSYTNNAVFSTNASTSIKVRGAATVQATFSAIDYTVTAAKAPSGIDTGNTITVNSAASATVHYNDTVNVRVTVATGYKLTSVKHGSTTVTMSGTTGTVTGSYTYTKTNGTSTTSETVTATFEAADPTVNTPTFSASHYAALSTYYTGDTYTVSSTATNNTSLTFQLIKSGEDPVAIADPNNFTISEAGTYTIKAIATNEPAGVASKSANASTANFTVVADSAPTSKAITAYIDFHDNTPVSPSIVINGSTSASLTRVGSSTVYSASVTVPYNYGPIAGSVNTALETSFPATITTDGNAYNVTISNASNKFINATTNEVWIEAQGVLGSTTSEPRKTTVNNSSDTKRIYVYKHSSYSDDQWYDVYLHYWGGATSTEWNTSSMPEMSYLTSYTNSSSQTYYVYYTDVPADTTHVKVAGTLLGGDQLNTSDAFEKELGDNNAVWLNNGGGCTMNATTAPTISSYTSVVTIQTGQTTSIAPTATGTVTYSSGDPTKVSVASNGTITAVAAGSTTLTITATGDRGDTVTATTNITVSDSSLTGSFIVMSYSSQQSQFSVDSNSKVRIDSLSTVLHGSKASGSSSTVRGGGIVTSTGSDYSKIYTVKYASPETSTGYGGLSLRVTANYTIANEECYFDGWYVGGVASTVYTTEDDAIKVDGNNFVLKFIEENTFTVTINYNYRVWNTANGIPYNAQFADDEHTTAKTKTETVKFKAATIENKDALEMIVNNCPSIINDYFNYKLVTKPYSAADTTSDAYKYGFTVTTSGKTCTINANLKRSAHKYVVTVNGHKYANTTYTYQKALEIKAGEVMNAAGVYEFNDDTVLNWYDGTQRMATGTSYKLRVTGDTTLTTTLGQSGDNNNGKSIISHKSHELKLEDSGVQKLIQNFYIADFINAELGGDEGEAEFVGGGVLYYAVNKTTGKATKATITNNSGEASSDDLEDVINRVVDGNYTTLKNNVTDSTSKVVCRYVPMTSGSSVYKYSQSLQAYQYIMSQKIINSSDYENYKYRMYSYFIYRVGSKYYISVSDNYADANLYEAE